MARKAKDILLARGYTEAELASLPLLQDARFCSAIEAEAEAADTQAAEAERLRGDIASDVQWYNNVVKPGLAKAAKEVADAKAEAAALKARVSTAHEYGMAELARQQDGGGGGTHNPNPNPNPNPNTANPANPDLDQRYVSVDVFQRTADRFGEATAMATDIADEHRELFGSRVPGGVTGLRDEYLNLIKANKYRGSLREYWESKYKVPDKRKEIATARTNKEIEDRVNAEVTKRMSQYGGNPDTRPMVPSRNPFTNRAQRDAAAGANGGSTGTGSGVKQPWERNEHERSTSRVSKFAAKVQ